MFKHLAPALIALAAVIGTAITDTASAQDPCPHDSVEHRDARITYGIGIDCGTFEMVVHGVRVGGGGQACPLFAIVEPPHPTTKHTPGSGTFTRPFGRAAVTRLEFACAMSWFLIFPVGRSCQMTRAVVTNYLTCYEQLPCATELRGGPSID